MMKGSKESLRLPAGRAAILRLRSGQARLSHGMHYSTLPSYGHLPFKKEGAEIHFQI